LHNQTFKDFEWIFVDGHYKTNKDLVEKLCSDYKINVIHVPMCGAIHIPRKYHWELYNNALLLSTNDLFLRFGIYRWMHQDVIGLAVEMANKNIYLNLEQKTDTTDYSVLETKTRHIEKRMSTQCGMFSFSKEKMLDMNGNNEAACLLRHYEDIELNNRWNRYNSKLESLWLSNALIRINHIKEYENQIINLNSKFPCKSKNCLMPENDSIIRDKNGNVMDSWLQFELGLIKENPNWIKFDYRDFTWVKCPNCETIAPINSQQYFNYLDSYKSPMASIGVDDRVGRNLLILNDDIKKLNSLQSKIDLLKSSHTNKRYLEDFTKNL
jgi:hypothetical protein